MHVELTVLAWGCVLGIVLILASSQLALAQFGMAWGLSSRETPPPPPSPLLGRVIRAKANFLETFPIAVAVILLVELTGANDRWTAIGAVLWLAARLGHAAVYALGITVIRTLLFIASLAGIGLMLVAVLR